MESRATAVIIKVRIMLLLGLEVAFIVATIPVGYEFLRSCWTRHVCFSRLTDMTAKRPSMKPEELRSLFRDLPMVYSTHSNNHTHGQCARNRSQASHFCDMFAKVVGMESFCMQMSNSDVRHNRPGSREYFWIKDLDCKPSSYTPKPNSVLTLIDTDYYVNMPRLAASRMQPIMLYTFQPGSAGKSAGEYVYTFQPDGSVYYVVNGGASYTHKVWDYGCDELVASSWFCGIKLRTVAYKVDKRRIDDDHQLILLTPCARWIFPFCYLTGWLDGTELERIDVVNKDYVHLDVMTKDGLMTSIGKVNNFTSAMVRTDRFEQIVESHRGCKLGITHMQVKSILRLKNEEECNVSALIRNYVVNCEPKKTILYGAEFTRSYQFKEDKSEDFDFEAKPSLVSFMAPLVDGAFAPAQCEGNNKQAIRERIENVRSDRDMTPTVLKWTKEFALLLAGTPNQLNPVDYDIVWARQSRPTQRRILEENDFAYPKHENKAFIKKECYGKLSDPRIISTINGNVKMAYSRYIYALDNVLKRQKWYAFGKTPLEIADRVAELCSNASNVCATDLSRMDGHVAKVLRIVERIIMMTLFRIVHHDDLIELMRQQHHITGKMGNYRWLGIWERLSGSAETSAFNTIDNAFMAFCEFRSSGQEPDIAYASLGIYGGDDGLTSNVSKQSYERMAKRLGQVLTCVDVKRGIAGVSFLNRTYGPDVWYGDNNSCCNMERALAKFHTTVAMPSNVKPEEKLADKAFAYYLSDKNTPLLGDFVSRVVEYLPKTYSHLNLCNVWDAKFEMDKQYPNESAAWMLDTLRKQFDVESLDSFFNWLNNPHSLTTLLTPVLVKFIDPKPHAICCVLVDDCIVEPVKSDVKRKSPVTVLAKAKTPKHRTTPKYGKKSTRAPNCPAKPTSVA
jgi:hypothetical protein